MYIINKLKSPFFIIFWLMVLTVSSWASQIEDMYKDLTLLDRTNQIGRKSYTTIGDKFYKLYAENPSGRYADDALLGAARAYRRSFERFNMQIDLDKALNYYRMVQGAFSSAAARRAYLESADIFIARRDSTSAKFTLNKLIQKHPKSMEAKEAEKKLASLGANNRSSITRPAPASTTNIQEQKPVIQQRQEPVKNIAEEDDKDVVSVSAGQDSGATASGKTVNVHGIRYFSDQDYTRIVIDLSNNAEYSSHWLKADAALHKPPR